MEKTELAARIHELGKLIDAQQERNLRLTEKLIPALQHGINTPTLQSQLSAGVNKIVSLCEEQSELISTYFSE